MSKINKSLIALSFSAGFRSPNIPIATIHQGDKTLNFILDTGSDDNVIDSNILPEIKHEILKEDNPSYLTGLGGTQIVQKCRVSFVCDNKEYTAVFLISDLKDVFKTIHDAHAIQVHGMLGSKFFKANNIVMDFNNMVAYSKE